MAGTADTCDTNFNAPCARLAMFYFLSTISFTALCGRLALLPVSQWQKMAPSFIPNCLLGVTSPYACALLLTTATTALILVSCSISLPFWGPRCRFSYVALWNSFNSAPRAAELKNLRTLTLISSGVLLVYSLPMSAMWRGLNMTMQVCRLSCASGETLLNLRSL